MGRDLREVHAVLTAFVLLLCTTPLAACMWDYDTLRDEQRGLPTVAAILAGKWEKHSPSFYEQRVERMREHLAERPDDLDALDNLAVALEKLGRVDEAIATLQPVVAEHPDRYTAHANLGTFYLHRSIEHRDRADLDRGIEHIERALQINPDAHFGREAYQLELAKYVRASIDDPAVLDGGSFIMPLLLGNHAEAADDDVRDEVRQDYLRRARLGRSGASSSELADAIEATTGMIRSAPGRRRISTTPLATCWRRAATSIWPRGRTCGRWSLATPGRSRCVRQSTRRLASSTMSRTSTKLPPSSRLPRPTPRRGWRPTRHTRMRYCVAART